MKGKTLLAIAIGYGLAKTGSKIIPAISEASRPVARMAMKTGLIMFEKTREKASEAGEFIEDIAAEVALELEQERAEKETQTGSDEMPSEEQQA